MRTSSPRDPMRILVISNLYPPHFIGGYELGCKRVMDHLSARGHTVQVLTSNYGMRAGSKEELPGQKVYRWLEMDLDWGPMAVGRHALRVLRKEVRNQRAFKRVVRLFQPDVIYIWNLRYVSVSLAVRAERLGLPVFYLVSDKWLAHWETDSWYEIWSSNFNRLAVRGLARLLTFLLRVSDVIYSGALTLPYVHFVSDFLKRDAQQAGKPVDGAEVIHWGVDVNKFAYKRECQEPKRLLYVGQITPLKGFRTIVEAMRLVVKEHGLTTATLTVVGGSIAPDFAAEMQGLVASYELTDNIKFAGFAADETLPEIYRQHEILLFPSLYDEALSITTLEAMSCGLAVVATATGGNKEVMEHGHNSLIFQKEDAQTCANHILRLFTDDQLFQSLRAAARETVEERFKIESMIYKIESSLWRGKCS
jgi:glycogen synthase